MRARCRFCQAGFTYRPLRERSPETLVDAAEKLIDSTDAMRWNCCRFDAGLLNIDGLTRAAPDGGAAPYQLVAAVAFVLMLSILILPNASRTRRGGLTLCSGSGTAVARCHQ